MTDAVQQTVENFIERMGLIAQGEGLSRTAGRVLGLLIIEGGPMSFGDLAARLQVSRGSISTNTRLLESLGILDRTARPGERQDYFQIRPQPYLHLLEGHLQRVKHARALVAETREGLPVDWNATRERLDELERFYAFLAERTQAYVSKNEDQDGHD